MRCPGIFEDRCAIANVISRVMPRWRPEAAEEHVVVDWTGYYSESFLQITFRRIGLDLVNMTRLPRLPPQTRLSTLSQFYGVNFKADDPRGTVPFLMYRLRDPNPTYEPRRTTKGVRRVNTKLFDLKQQLRGTGAASALIHATDNIRNQG